MAYYRTYRPQVIEEMDNAHVREQLLALLTRDRSELPHAYVFTGPKGTGKTTAARLIAKLFTCQKLKKTGPCGICDACKSIAAGSNVDVLEIDAASNRGIDEMRQLRDRIGLAPSAGDYKIYIIDEVHMLTNEAFNALLKTLEEPPRHAVFVLATTDPQKVPGTIMSRCLHVPFHRASADELVHVLARIAKAEKVTIDDESLALIAKCADGSFRDGAKLLEQVSLTSSVVTADVVRRTLTLTDASERMAIVDHLAARDTVSLLADIARLVAAGRDLKSYMIDVLSDLEYLLVGLATDGIARGGWTIPDLQRAIRGLTAAFEEYKYTPIPQLPLELFVIEFCGQFAPATNPASESVKPSPAVGAHAKSATQTRQVTTQVSGDTPPVVQPLGLLTMEKLVDHWQDVIAATKPYNHSIAGVLRSSRPKGVSGGIVTIEAFFPFHQEKLSEVSSKQMLGDLLKKLFGEKVKVEIVLGKK